MSKIGELVNEIENKIKRLVAEYKSISLQNSQLIRLNKELTETIEEKEKTIKQIIDKSSYIKISQLVKQSEENEDVKNKIDELVREIDKCISLLNK